MENSQIITEAEMAKLYKIKKTLLKMLSDRGYLVSNKDLSMTLEEWKNNFQSVKESMSYYTTKKKKNSAEGIFVEYNDSNSSLSFEEIERFYNQIKDKGITAGIIITKEPPTPMAKLKIQKIKDAVPIEYFEANELIINITEHELVPKHELLSDEEKEQLLKR